MPQHSPSGELGRTQIRAIIASWGSHIRASDVHTRKASSEQHATSTNLDFVLQKQ